MAGNTGLTKAIEVVKQAAAFDSDGNYPEAIKLYLQGLEWFNHALKYDKNERTQKTIKMKMTQYMDRVELLRANVASGGGSSGTAQARKPKPSDDGKSADDAEKEKMKGAMDDAIQTEKPNIHWDEVAGLEGAKEALKEAVIMPKQFPQLFRGERKPWRGILLYGPPGTGKTYLAKALATESEACFMSVSSADLVSKWLGESEQRVRQMFETARENKPSIVFVDEIDSLWCALRRPAEQNAQFNTRPQCAHQTDALLSHVQHCTVGQ